MVFFNPSLSPISCLQPICFILDISKSFLGVPLGFDSSHLIFPSKLINSAINKASSLIEISLPVPTFKKGILLPSESIGDKLLLSDEGSFINGAELVIDGGYSINKI